MTVDLLRNGVPDTSSLHVLAAGAAALLYPLSAAMLLGFLRGLPGPRRGTRIFSSPGTN